MNTSQIYEAFLPVYDAIPELWEEAKPFLVENLKKISQGVNDREIGLYLDNQLLTGGQFIPVATSTQEYRSIFRKVINTGALIAGVNTFPHGVTFDVNFTLIDLWVSATDSVGFNAITMSDPANVTMDATNINITSPSAFDRSFAFVEYILEI